MGACCTGLKYLSLIIVFIAVCIQLWINFGDQREFNYRTLADEAASDADLSGIITIVTGANAGLGKVTTRVLISHGAKVVMACRSEQRAISAKADIIQKLLDPNDPAVNFLDLSEAQLEESLDIMMLDLSSLESVSRFAETFLSKYDQLNMLVLNAGISYLPQWTPTVDGLESHFGINHVGHFYLTSLLNPLLIESAKTHQQISRVVVVSSQAHWIAPLSLNQWFENEELLLKKDIYGKMRHYAVSKAANILFAKHFNRKFSEKNVHAVSVHPGLIITDIVRHLPSYIQALMKLPIVGLFTKNVEQGAATGIRTLTMEDDEFAKFGGSYFADCNVAYSRWDTHDELLQVMLWNLTKKMIDDRRHAP